MTREQARKALNGTSLFPSRGGKAVVRDMALIRAVQAHEEKLRSATRPVHAVN